MFDLTFSGTQVLLGTGMLFLGLSILYFSMKYYFSRELKNTAAESSRTKYARVDVFRHRPAFLKISLLAVLAFTLLAFNWTQYGVRALPDSAVEMDLFDINHAPPITFHKPPPPPPPPPPLIEVIPDELVKESKTFRSMDAHLSDKMAITVFATDVPPPPPPPPPPPVYDEGSPFRIVERMPVFGDCADELSEDLRRNCSNKALMKFIGEAVRYPAIARETGISGTAVIRFVIEKNGSMTKLEVVRDPGGGLGLEAMRVAELMAKKTAWTAGQQRGRPVRVQFNLPIRFKLQ